MFNVLNTFSRIYKDVKFKNNLPLNHLVDDVYIVSYPKSGSTWFRFLIANAIKLHYNINREVNFFTIKDIIPGVENRQNMNTKGPFGISELPRILRSHASFNPYFRRVILLVRDPRDVMISYYYHLLNYKIINQSSGLSDFIYNQSYGIHSWKKHTESWLPKEEKAGKILKLVRYEDLKKNTEIELNKILDLLGISIDKELLHLTIEASSITKMKESENKHLHYLNPETLFVRKAKSTQGEELKEKDKEYIENIAFKLLSELGYL
jgi:hypothetical protein